MPKVKCRVLIVDDNETVRKVVEDHFTNGGYAVAEARDGIQGLEMALQERANIIGRAEEERLDAAPGGRHLGVPRHGDENIFSPLGERAIRRKAAIEVDPSDVRIGSDVAELDPDATALPVDDFCSPRFGFSAGSPGRGINTLIALLCDARPGALD